MLDGAHRLALFAARGVASLTVAVVRDSGRQRQAAGVCQPGGLSASAAALSFFPQPASGLCAPVRCEEDKGAERCLKGLLEVRSCASHLKGFLADSPNFALGSNC